MKKPGTNNKLERQIKKDISGWLSIHPEVIWWERLNSGTVKTAWGSWVRMCREGTADLVALIKADIVHVLFIETKRVGKKQDDAQVDFQESISGHYNVHYIVATSPSVVNETIDKILHR